MKGNGKFNFLGRGMERESKEGGRGNKRKYRRIKWKVSIEWVRKGKEKFLKKERNGKGKKDKWINERKCEYVECRKLNRIKKEREWTRKKMQNEKVKKYDENGK